MPLATGLALALSAVISTNAQVAVAAPAPLPAAQTVEQYVDSQFADAPVMTKIAECESQFRQFNTDGSVLQNPKSSAVGVFQIMSSIYKDPANEKLGLDIDTLEGNVAYAKVLYEEFGTKPWNSSKACWDSSQSNASELATTVK